jgi:F0F1-type ATP synthase assembly protein I
VNSFDRYVRQVFFGTLSLVLAMAGIFLFSGHRTWARGFVLGGIASLANLLIMAGDVRRQGKTVSGRLVRPAYGAYALRMVITAAALIYAAVSSKIALWAAVPALFASQAAMTCGELLGSRKQEDI